MVMDTSSEQYSSLELSMATLPSMLLSGLQQGLQHDLLLLCHLSFPTVPNPSNPLAPDSIIEAAPWEI